MTIPGRTQAYGAGNKTYGFGRSNPTSGPVDKLGYRERDLSQNTFQSALARRSTTAQPQGSPQGQPGQQQQGGQPQAAATSTGTIGTSISPMHTQQAQQGAPTWNANSNYTTQPGYSAGGNGGVPQDYANPAGPVFRSISADTNRDAPRYQIPGQPETYGQPGNPTNGNAYNGNAPQGDPIFHGTPATMPPPPAVPPVTTPDPNLNDMGDVEYQNALNRLTGARGQANMQYATGVNDANTHAYQMQRDINQQAPLTYEALLGKFASHGMAHSGRYAQDFGTAQADTAKQLYDVDNQKSNQLNQLLSALTGANQQYDTGAMDANQSLAQRLAAQAGKLGLDKTTKNPVAAGLNTGEHGGLDRPLPARSKAIDKSVTSIPSSKWTDRQVAYAAKYNLQGKR